MDSNIRNTLTFAMIGVVVLVVAVVVAYAWLLPIFVPGFRSGLIADSAVGIALFGGFGLGYRVIFQDSSVLERLLMGAFVGALCGGLVWYLSWLAVVNIVGV